jgi:cysteine desulfurase
MALARACELLAFEDHGGMAALRDRFERQLFTALEDIEINAGGSDRLPNTSNVLFRGVSAETMLIALDTAGYAVSTGAACSSGSIEASHVLLAIGRSPEEARSSVRFSFGRTNTGEETDRLAETVIALVQRLRKTRETRHQLVG